MDELLLQRFNLALEVHSRHVGVIDDLPQANDVSLHGLTDRQLRFVSEQTTAESAKRNVKPYFLQGERICLRIVHRAAVFTLNQLQLSDGYH